MRIAVFSDVHGNPFVCETVLKEIENAGPFDAVVAAGDSLFGGSDPARCAELLMASGAQVLYGNTEEYIRAPQLIPPDKRHARKWDRLQPIAYWIREQLSPQQLAWVDAMPFEARFSPTNNPQDDLLVVHANPKDNLLFIYPEPVDQITVFGEVSQPDDDPDLNAYIEGVTAHTVAFGHLHWSSVRHWNGYTLVNVAACSGSVYNGLERARFTVFTWTGDSWALERHAIKYEAQLEAAALRASTHPDKETWAKTYDAEDEGV